MTKTRPCPECQEPVSLKTRQCPTCNALVNPNAPLDPISKAKEDAEVKRFVLMGVGAMLLFFGFFFSIPMILADMGFIWIALILIIIGIVLLVWSLVVKIRLKKQIAKLEKELHTTCGYCGGTNHKTDHRCLFCGAPL